MHSEFCLATIVGNTHPAQLARRSANHVTTNIFISRILICLLISLGFAAPTRAAEYEARIWSSKGGKHQIRAKFIDLNDGTVRLERPNGDISRLPLDKLSQEDQDYVRNADKPEVKQEPPAAAAPLGLQVGDRVEAKDFGKWKPATVTEIDYKWKHAEVRYDDGDTDGHMSMDDLRYPGTQQQPFLVKPPSPESSLKTVRPDLSEVDRPLADGTPADQVAPDPLATASWKPRAVRLGGRQDFFEKPTDFAIVASPTPMAIIVHANGHHEDAVPRVELIDLQTRKMLVTGPAPAGTGKLALSPSGSTVATSPADHGGSKSTGRIDFWKIADKKVDHLVSFVPYVMNAWPDLDPEWSAWLDDERLFTVNNEGQLILWQVEGAKAVYELMIDRSSRPILTHGRKHLVVPTSTGVQFFDAKSGELEAVVGSGDCLRAALAFSPSGKQLAIVSSGFVDVLDVTTGETTRSFPCQGANSRDAIAWVDEDYLFTANGLIINVPLRLIAWKYEIRSSLVKSLAGTHWALLENRANKSQVLTPLELPPAEAVAAVDHLDKEQLLVVRPGDTIDIDVQISDGLLAEEVKRSLAEALVETGMKVGDDSGLRLVARTSTGETQKVHYRRFHVFRGEGETIDVTSRVYEIELLLDGAVVWERKSTHSAPRHLQLQEGETIRAAIARVMKPRAGYFRGRLPSYVVRPEYLEPLGSSKLSLGP